ncbi:MAG: hypothetical protein ACP5E5_05435 [Acidobacteriaceae bacterium]
MRIGFLKRRLSSIFFAENRPDQRRYGEGMQKEEFTPVWAAETDAGTGPAAGQRKAAGLCI